MLESIVNMMGRINKNAEEQHGSNNLLSDNIHLGGDVRLFLFLLNLSMFSPNTSPVLNLRGFENHF